MSQDSVHTGEHSAKIQLIVQEQGDESALTQLLNSEYEVIISPELESADCYIIDAQELPRYYEALVERKRQANPVFLPSLLIQRESVPLDVDDFERQAGDVVLIDELIHAPVGKPVLDRRIENLLARRRQSQSLQSDYQRMHRAVFSSGHAIYITDTEGNIEYVNPAFEEITEYFQEEAVGRNPRIMNSGEMPDEYFEDLWNTVTSGDVWKEEVINRRKSGEKYVAEQTIAPVTDPNGDIEGFVAIQQDITEREQERQKLREFRQTVQASSELLAAIDTDLEYLFANDAYLAYHGISGESVESRSLRDVLGSERFAEVESAVRAAMDGERQQVEITREHPELGERMLDARIFPIQGDDGSIQGVGASMHDITEQKQLERELRDQKERYESLFNSIQDAILVADTERRIINCNPGFTEHFGYELDEITGKPTKFVYESEEEFEEMGEEIRRHLGDSSFTYTINYQKKSGQVFPGETSTFYLRDSEDEIIGFIGVIRDISDRQERLKQLKNFDRLLQHNFRNDMNVIEGHLQLAAETGDPTIKSHLETTQEKAKGLRETVEKEREITAILTDTPPKVTVDIGSTVEEVVGRVLASYPQAEVSVDGPRNVDVRAILRIDEALEELLENGITHSESQSPTIHVRLRLSEDTVSIAIEDEGPPIPEFERKILMDEIESSPLKHHSGMGLWLVQIIVNKSDGTLGFEVTEKGGNIVTMRLQRPSND